MLSVKEIEAIGSSVKPSNPVGACEAAAKEAASLLEEEGASFVLYDGFFDGGSVGGVQTAEHWFIVIPEQSVTGSDEQLILDPTIEQFTGDYFHNGNGQAYIPASIYPGRLVIYESDAVFDAYVMDSIAKR